MSMCRSSRSSGAGPRNFAPSRSRSRPPYIGSPLNTSYAEFSRFMLQFLCLKRCVYGGGVVPHGGGGGGRHLATVPQGVAGDRLPWGGAGQGGGGYIEVSCRMMGRMMEGCRALENPRPGLAPPDPSNHPGPDMPPASSTSDFEQAELGPTEPCTAPRARGSHAVLHVNMTERLMPRDQFFARCDFLCGHRRHVRPRPFPKSVVFRMQFRTQQEPVLKVIREALARSRSMNGVSGLAGHKAFLFRGGYLFLGGCGMSIFSNCESQIGSVRAIVRLSVNASSVRMLAQWYMAGNKRAVF